MSKYKVLLVDDEPVVREGIKILIEWERYNFEVVACASDGEEALEAAIKHKVDLIVTDIRMPVLDGIGLAKRIKEQVDFDPEFIFVSGYSDFEYAKEAIDLGVSSYILKPIDEDEMHAALEHTAKRLDKKRTAMQKESQDIGLKLRNVFVKQEIDEQFIASLKTSVFKMIEFRGLESPISLVETINHLNLEFTQYVFTYGVHVYMITENVEEIILNAIAVDLNEKSKREVNVYATEAYSDVSKLYPEILMLHELKYLYPQELFFTKKRSQALTKSYTGTINFEEETLKVLKLRDHTALLNIMEHYKNYLKDSYIAAQDIQDRTVSLYWFLLRNLDQRIIDESNPHLAMKLLYDSPSIDALISTFEQIIFQLMELYVMLFGDHDIIATMKEYIQKNYTTKLTLKSIAQQFGYNSAYIGKKFKDDTSYSFNHYLDVVRIDNAKRLLASTSYMVYEIAQNVGFTNIDVFYKKFKEQTQLSPNEYRKQYRTDEQEVIEWEN